jgi:cytochrome P450
MTGDSTRLDDWNLMDPAVQQCPYDFYRATRAVAPVYRMPQTGFYLVTSFELCREVIRQPDVFASAVSPMALREGGVPQAIIDIYQNEGWIPTTSCSTTDPPQHTRVRSFLEPLFTVQRVREMTPMIDATVRELLDGLAGRTEVEFVQEFSHPLPMMVIADLIGVPRVDLARFKAWSDAIVEPFSMMVTPERELECARLVVDMQHYFAGLLEERRRSPRDDLLTAVARAADDPDLHFDMREQLTILTIDLLASGNETTTAAITSGLKLVIEDPGALQEARGNPKAMRNLAEEILRLESPAQGMFRRVMRDTVLGGVELREGDLLSVRFGAANRDETQFPQAERIDLHRSQPGKHLALGIGRHHCIGAQLARQEIVSALTGLSERYEAFALTPGRPEPEYAPSFFGRNLRRFFVTLTPRAASTV